jgi:hypothetical protein
MSTHSKVEVFSLAFGRKGGWSMAARERDGWLSDFSLVLSREHFRSVRRDPEYEVFSGSKPLALLWLVVVAAVSGALGGTLVSGALWGPWWQVPAWIAVLVATATIVVAPTLALSGQPLGFIAGWSLFWGLLIGAVAMWGAQLNGAGWGLWNCWRDRIFRWHHTRHLRTRRSSGA